MESKLNQAASAQIVSTKRKSVPRSKRKRARNLMPELRRRQIPGLFHVCGDSERVGETFGIPRIDVVDAVLSSILRRPVQAEQRPVLLRKAG